MPASLESLSLLVFGASFFLGPLTWIFALDLLRHRMWTRLSLREIFYGGFLLVCWAKGQAGSFVCLTVFLYQLTYWGLLSRLLLRSPAVWFLGTLPPTSRPPEPPGSYDRGLLDRLAEVLLLQFYLYAAVSSQGRKNSRAKPPLGSVLLGLVNPVGVIETVLRALSEGCLLLHEGAIPEHVCTGQL